MAAKGGWRPGAGRKKGIPNRKTAELQARVAAEGITPLEFLLQTMRDPGNDLATRLDAAKAAAPYVHARLSAIELSREPEARGMVLSRPLTAEEWAAKHGGEVIEVKPFVCCV